MVSLPADQRGHLQPEDSAVVAAIVAAVEVAWPRTVVVVDEARRPPAWRFSNRWWMPRRAPLASRQRP